MTQTSKSRTRDSSAQYVRASSLYGTSVTNVGGGAGGAHHRSSYEQFLPPDVNELVRATARNVRALGKQHRGASGPVDMNRSNPSTAFTASSSADDRISDTNGCDFEVESADEHRRWRQKREDNPPHSHQQNHRSHSGNTSREYSSRPPTAPPPPMPASSSSAPLNFSSEIGRKWGPAFEQIARNITTPRAQSPTLHEGFTAVTTNSASAAEVAAASDPIAAVDAKLARERDEAVLKSTSAELARLKIDMKEAAMQHEEALHELKLKHARELNALRDEVLAARQQAASEATERMLASFSVKQQLLLSEIENGKMLATGEKARSDELEKKLYVMSADLTAANHRIQQLQNDLEERRRHYEVAQLDITTLRKDIDRAEELLRTRDAELRAHRQREANSYATERSLVARAEQLEERLRENEADATSRLRTIEEEFLGSNQMYQQLLTEASSRIEKYEKLKIKYRDAKELLAAKEKMLDEVTAQQQAERRRFESESQQTAQELTRLSSIVAQREHEARDERSKCHQRIEELERDLRESRSESEDRQAAMRTEVANLTAQLHKAKQDIAAANHTVSLLQEQLAVSREQLLASEGDADSKLRECREMIENTRSQSMETIAALKRQLAEKDKKLEQLVAASGEVQKWRKQLEDERGKRAAAEEQLSNYRQKARDAEEAALLEVRKEQLRQSTAAALERTSAPAKGQQQVTSAGGTGNGSKAGEKHGAAAAPKQQVAEGTAQTQAPVVADQQQPKHQQPRQPSHRSQYSTADVVKASTVQQPLQTVVESTREPHHVSAHNNLANHSQSSDAMAPAAAQLDANSGRERMHTFHTSAQEVHQRIAESREEFLVKCASIVRSLRYRGGGGGGSGSGGGRAANEENSSDSD